VPAPRSAPTTLATATRAPRSRPSSASRTWPTSGSRCLSSWCTRPGHRHGRRRPALCPALRCVRLRAVVEGSSQHPGLTTPEPAQM
jgi:hypothetical protein